MEVSFHVGSPIRWACHLVLSRSLEEAPTSRWSVDEFDGDADRHVEEHFEIGRRRSSHVTF